MREPKKKNYWGLLSLLAFVAAIALGYFVLYPMINNLKEVNIKVAAKDSEINDLGVKISALEKLSLAFGNSPEKVKMLDLAIPEDDMQAEIIATLSNIASNSGMTITSIAQKKSQDKNFTSISVGFESSYAGAKLFLESMENNIRYANVKNMTLTRNQKTDGGEGFITGTVTLDLFKFAGTALNQTQEITEGGQ